MAEPPLNGVAETGVELFSPAKISIKILSLQCSFRLSEKNEKDKKRKAFLF